MFLSFQLYCEHARNATLWLAASIGSLPDPPLPCSDALLPVTMRRVSPRRPRKQCLRTADTHYFPERAPNMGARRTVRRGSALRALRFFCFWRFTPGRKEHNGNLVVSSGTSRSRSGTQCCLGYITNRERSAVPLWKKSLID